MAPATPRQQINRDRFEGLIALAAPVLDVVLAVGDRLSRVASPQSEYYPIRPPGETFEVGPPKPPGSGSAERAEAD